MGDYTLIHGDCLDVMAEMPDACVDSIVTDPPYGLGSEPDMTEVLTHWLAGDDYQHRGGGFMGKSWDSFVPGPAVWREALRVLKPGGMALVFGGTRTYDLTVLALRLAGFEIRDCVGYAWTYAQGFPKSHDISKAIDQEKGAERKVVGPNPHARPSDGKYNAKYSGVKGHDPHITAPATPEAEQWYGWGTSLKPAFEPIVLAMKPRDGTFANNALAWGCAGLNIDGCRVPTNGEKLGGGAEKRSSPNFEAFDRPWKHGPEEQKRVAATVREKVKHAEEAGRWPANLILDEHAGRLLDAQSGELTPGHHAPNGKNRQAYESRVHENPNGWKEVNRQRKAEGYADTGGASRFFYCAKASKRERNDGLPDGMQNRHPTVKPLSLLRFLCRLLATPTGGVVLDPFMGSGSTGVAALHEGREFIGIELERESFDVAQARIEHAAQQAPQERQTELI